jgi:hypothetical protein
MQLSSAEHSEVPYMVLSQALDCMRVPIAALSEQGPDATAGRACNHSIFKQCTFWVQMCTRGSVCSCIAEVVLLMRGCHSLEHRDYSH